MATLLDAFRKATKDSNLFEEYIEARTKYLRVLMSGTDASMEEIRETSPLTPEQTQLFEEMSMTLTQHFSKQAKVLREELLNLVKHIDLHKCKIMGYTEFDMIEWYLDAHDWNYLHVKFKPKDVAVSFWTYKADDIEYNF